MAEPVARFDDEELDNDIIGSGNGSHRLVDR